MSNLPQEDYDYAEVIGRNLQRLINERGTTQAAIAQKLGIARSGINKYVQGVSSPSPGISCASHGPSASPPTSCCV